MCEHLQIYAALIVPNGSDTVALGRNFEIQIPRALSLTLCFLEPCLGIKAESATEYFAFA